MTEHRIKTERAESATDPAPVINLDSAWGLTFDSASGVRSSTGAINVEHGDQLIIGVAPGAAPLSSVCVIVNDPSGARHQLDTTSSTDGQTVTVEDSSGKKKVLNIKLVDENDLPDS